MAGGKDPWAERIAAVTWPAAIVLCVLSWQRWLTWWVRQQEEQARRPRA